MCKVHMQVSKTLTSSLPTATKAAPLRLEGTVPLVRWCTQGSLAVIVKGLPLMGNGSGAPSSV